MKIKDKIKEFLEEVKDTVDWIVAGCPKPVKIPVKPKGGSGEMRFVIIDNG